MGKGWAAALAGVVMLALGVPAATGSPAAGRAAPLRFGVVDDYAKYTAACLAPSPFYAAVKDIGYRVVGMTVPWDEGTAIDAKEKAFLDRAVPCAVSRKLRVVLALYPRRAASVGTSAAARADFAAFAAGVVRAYPQVTDFVIGNEPNQNRFWQPQAGVGAAYEAVLADAYDAIKAVRRKARVLGFAISGRGNDRPHSPSNASTSPVQFVHDAAAAYRASGRKRPLMDAFAFHPYPADNTYSYARRFLWPNAGAADLARVKQALWDGFHGTAQPMTPICLCETGTQTALDGHEAAYTGTENVPVVSAAVQAAYYARLAGLAACDPAVEALLLYPLVDDPQLDRFQSGQLYADLARKDSYDTMKRTIATSRGACAGALAVWAPAKGVVGAGASFDLQDRGAKSTGWGFHATAREDAAYGASLLDARGNVVLTTEGSISAYYHPYVQFPQQRLPAGNYRYAIRMRAAMSPARTTSFRSRLFTVLR